jgi:hypothetical protein
MDSTNRPRLIERMRVDNTDTFRISRIIALTTIVVIVLLLWAAIPYGDSNGTSDTFASSLIKNASRFSRDLPHDFQHDQISTNRLISWILDIVTPFLPLYPGVLAGLSLVRPNWPAAWPRWIWIIQGIAVIALMPLVLLWAYFEVFNFAGPVLNPSLWLLLGLNVVSGVCAIAIGLAPAFRRALLPGG